MSNLLTDIKGISAEDILPLASEERDTEPIENGVGVFFSQFEILKCEISYVYYIYCLHSWFHNHDYCICVCCKTIFLE